MTTKYLETGEWLVQNTMEKCFLSTYHPSKLHNFTLHYSRGFMDVEMTSGGGFAQSFRILLGDGQIKEGPCEKNTKQNFGMHDN